MATVSYDKNYLPYVADNIGTMFDYAVACQFKPAVFWNMFVNSNVAKQIEKGNPRYLAGFSAVDFFNEIINTISGKKVLLLPDPFIDRTAFFWSGWAIAQYQWFSGNSFLHINENLPVERVIELYSTLHEADITKFIEIADENCRKLRSLTHLQNIRIASGLSQSELADQADIEPDAIQRYEQRNDDINKAPAIMLYKLAKTLGCNMEDFLEEN